ncbi:lytic transglycosylase domain-containing protein [Daejeonella oryzae]|uniref:lytic transglycosylase domain-containing protein n=1 Tax=Daejeonella oryzae TaxID=1122943 RepID=UPI00040081CF|nr:lytic transglycosylase domain-containing protein [Daejeonella oryzae]
MMKKTMAFALFIFSAASVFAAPEFNNVQDSIHRSEERSPGQKDTLFVSALPQNPLLSYQSLIYKKRLDSLKMSVPMDYNEHVQNYIDLYVFNRKDQIAKMLGLSKYYFPIFEKSLMEIGVPDEIKFISVIESALNPNAVSRSGAVGPWQFMYTTAKGYGLVMDSYVDERKDPVQASYAAARYLKDSYNRFGDWLLAIAAYNCGSGAVGRAITKAGGKADFWAIRPYLPRETQNYVPAFIATAYAMNYYAKHDINPAMASFNIFTDAVDVTKFISLSNIARAVEVDIKELRLLNPSYKKDIVNGSVKSPKTLIIPSIDKQLYSSLYNLLNPETDNEPAIIAASLNSPSGSPASVNTFHRVTEGQTLAMVANQYGVEVQDLKVWNNLKIMQIVPGQQIRVKAFKSTVTAQKSDPLYKIYIVKAGDTLAEIANRFNGTSVSKLKALNGLKSSALQPGMRLKVNQSL